MNTRIREIRKERRLTLEALAREVGTTAQTIQRLETDNMTVSVDWLTRIAAALRVTPAALLADGLTHKVRLIGEIDGQGRVVDSGLGEAETVTLTVPATSTVAVRIAERLGPYEPGTLLVASEIDLSRLPLADGRDCLLRVESGAILFRRLIVASDRVTAFVPYHDGARSERNLRPEWVATVAMAVRYLGQH